MLCFTTIERDVSVEPGALASEWELKVQPLDQIQSVVAAAPVFNPAAEVPKSKEEAPAAAVDDADELSQKASDGFLINGTVNNGASTPFALAAAFGNDRRTPHSMYNGNIGMTVDNSTLDARSFSLTGQDTPKPVYNHLTGMASFGGPIKIPHLLKNGPLLIVHYQWTRNRNASIDTGLVPTLAERSGDLSQLANAIFDPRTGSPFPGNIIPQSRMSPQATALLNYYPLPNFAGSSQYNYQIPIVGDTHQDSLQSRVNKTIGRKDQVSGNFDYQSTRSDSDNLFEFLDKTGITGINTSATWRHIFSTRLYSALGYQYSFLSTRVQPFFANRENVSGNAGITGNNQDPINWGPPALNFSSGIAPLSDAEASNNRTQTGALSYSMLAVRGRHNISFGTDYKKLQFNYLSQEDPRGTFTFTGAAAGSDFAGFLLGVPDTSSIAYGNADKYFRTSTYDAFMTDDFRVGPNFTLNAGVRWEYESPIAELYGRLVNLDITPGFAAVAPVVANDPVGPLTGTRYPDSLIHPDKHGFEPRVGLSWRPFSASSMVVRAGYGVYYNTSAYQTIAEQMAQQSPLSKSLSVQNSSADPLTLANGFNTSPLTTPNTFAIDPNFLIGYAQNWQASIQRDLPGSLVVTATYLGIKGTRGVQDFLPNTYPLGAVNPCSTCPTGFAYLTSNGNSTRESGQIQLRRRLHNGVTASASYTYSKSIDDSALGGRNQGVPVIAQNWHDLSAESGSVEFRPAPLTQRSGTIYERHGNRRPRSEWMARGAAERVDDFHDDHGRQWIPVDAELPCRGSWHRSN